MNFFSESDTSARRSAPTNSWRSRTWEEPDVAGHCKCSAASCLCLCQYHLHLGSHCEFSLSLTAFPDILCRQPPPCGAGAPLFSPLSIYFLIFSYFYFSLSFIGFTYFLLLSIPSLSTRIVPLHFQTGGHRKRPNLGLVCVLLCNLCYLYSLVKMDSGVLFCLV